MYGTSFFVICLALFYQVDAQLLSNLTATLTPDTNCGALGNFSNANPWTSLTRPVPPPNCNFNVSFYLCKNGSEPVLLPTRPTIDFNGTGFDPSRRLRFVVHGFRDYVKNWWPQRLGNTIEADVRVPKGATFVSQSRSTKIMMLQSGDNVIAVDWSEGAKGPNYLQVTSNTRVTGAEIARVIRYIITTYGVSKDNITLIGHSLGAHICAYTSNMLNGLGYIIGLDPAQPLFESEEDNVIFLDKSDACFVEVIHTSGRPFIPTLGFGFMRPCGDVDFYPNGGAVQPGCPDVDPLINGTTFLGAVNSSVVSKAVVSCGHCRAYELLIDSVKFKNCTMWGHSISSCEEYSSLLINGLVTTSQPLNSCDTASYSPMGLNATMFKAQGCFTLSTKGDSPYCIPDPQANVAMSMRQLDEAEIIRNLCTQKNII